MKALFYYKYKTTNPFYLITLIYILMLLSHGNTGGLLGLAVFNAFLVLRTRFKNNEKSALDEWGKKN